MKKYIHGTLPKQPPTSARVDGLRWLTIILLTAVLVMLVIDVFSRYLLLPDPAVASRAVTPRGDLAGDEASTVELFREASPSVVYITSIARRRSLLSLNVFEIPQGTGSGFIWSDDGYIVTNFHVIKDANAADVTLADGSTWKAKLVGFAADKDLAVVKIDAAKSLLKPISVGTSSDLEVGQKVLAVGNPFGLDQTLTTGVISGLGRQIESVTRRPINGVIQTDAAINPGNSGGPLLDSAGRLIGVNTAIYSPSGVYAGIGFAVPVDTVNRVVPQLILHGEVRKAGLGITIAEDHVARRLGVSGVVIIDIVSKGPADQAGLRPTTVDRQGRLSMGDVIVGIDSEVIESNNDLFQILDEHDIGDTVNVVVSRSGRRIEVPLTLSVI